MLLPALILLASPAAWAQWDKVQHIQPALPNQEVERVLDDRWRQNPGKSVSAWLSNNDPVRKPYDNADNVRHSVEYAKKYLCLDRLYAVVWNKGNVFAKCPGTARQQTNTDSVPSLKGRDVLEELMQAGARHGVEIAPWFESGFSVPTSSPLFKSHPDWFLARCGTARPVVARVHNGVEMAYMNPSHAAVRAYMRDLILGVVNCHLDHTMTRVVLDDNFIWPNDYGCDETTRKAYQTAYPAAPWPPAVDDAQFNRWKAAQLTALVGDLHRGIQRSRRPDLKLYLAPNKLNFARTRQNQNWDDWRRMGLIDGVIEQSFHTDSESYTKQAFVSPMLDGVKNVKNAVTSAQGLLPKGEALARGAVLPAIDAVIGKRSQGTAILCGIQGRKRIDAATINRQVRTAELAGFQEITLFHLGTCFEPASNETLEGRLKDLGNKLCYQERR